MVRPLQGDCAPDCSVSSSFHPPNPQTADRRPQTADRILTRTFDSWAQEEEYKGKTYFAKFDVDAVPELAQELGIRAMPTFVFFKNGEKVDEVVGASPPALLKVLKEYNPAEAQAADKDESAPEGDHPTAELPAEGGQPKHE
jgi:hypothetical protein